MEELEKDSRDINLINNKNINTDTKTKDKNTEDSNTVSRKRKKIEIDQYRVVITKDTNKILEEMTEKVCDGFSGAEITKSDIVNLIVANYTKVFSEADVRALRNQHFNERKVLKTLLRGDGSVDDLPEEIRRAVREHFGMVEPGKKRSRSQQDIPAEKNLPNSNAA